MRSPCAHSSSLRGLRRWGMAAALAMGGAFVGAVPAAVAQTPSGPLPRGTVISPILTIDADQLWQQSLRGQQIARGFEDKVEALNAENDEIEAELEAEESALTEQRAAMVPAEFRVLADAFDEKVQGIRAQQAEKSRALTTEFDTARDAFLRAAQPTLGRLMREAGAVVILERRSVLISATAIDITDRAIALLDDAHRSQDSAE